MSPVSNPEQYSPLPDSEEAQSLLAERAYDLKVQGDKERRLETERYGGPPGYDEARSGVKSPLLYDEDSGLEDDPKGWSRRKIVCTATGLIMLLVAGAMMNCVSRSFTASWMQSDEAEEQLKAGPHKFSGDVLRSNGTHDFRRTVLIVSIDGLRADYLDRGLTPHILDISKKGLRAKSMKPIFPTLTFPNHWTLMTGLHAESHGIVANNFWDPATQEEFHYNQIASAWKSTWWLGEPMWETAEKAGIVTANLMWPGPPKTTSGTSSTFFVPWKDKVSLDEKLGQIIEWIDLPLHERPQLIMAYEPSLDQAGHATGPYSKRVNATLLEIDAFAKKLHTALEARHLNDIVDIIFVSDHGMTDTSNPELVYIDDILGVEGLKAIEHEDGWPSMGLRFRPNVDSSVHLLALLAASEANPEKFDVYTHETMPARYHFANHERIAPIYIIPNIGYVLTTRAEGNVGMSKGNHGYDNDEPSMHAMFVAHGPFSHDAKVLHQRRGAELGHLLQGRDSLKRGPTGWHSTSDGAYIMETFQNVEVYNLVLKLLGADRHVAPNNGTAGFWDQYL